MPDDWTIDRRLDQINQSLDAVVGRLVSLEQKTDEIMIVLKQMSRRLDMTVVNPFVLGVSSTTVVKPPRRLQSEDYGISSSDPEYGIQG